MAIGRYLNSTPIYQIPYGRIFEVEDGRSGIGVLANEEWHGKNIIDFQLRGGALVFGSGVISEGIFSESIIGGISTVTVSSLRAITNNLFIFNDSGAAWTNVSTTINQYLAVGPVEENPAAPAGSTLKTGDFVTAVFGSAGAVPDDHILIAIRDATSGEIISDPSLVPGKQFISLQTHIDKANPHGETLYQDYLTASGVTMGGLLSGTLVIGDWYTSGISIEGGQLNSSGNFIFRYGILHNDVLGKDGATFLGGTTFFSVVSGNLVTHDSVVFEYPEHFFSGLDYTDAFGNPLPPQGQKGLGEQIIFGDMTLHDDIEFIGAGTSFGSGGWGSGPWGGLTSDTARFDADAYVIDYIKPSDYGSRLDAHLAKTDNPHKLTPFILSGLSLFGASDPALINTGIARTDDRHELVGHLPVADGVTIDGVDLSETSILMDGGNADYIPDVQSGHMHLLLGDRQWVFESPEFGNVTLSGNELGLLDTQHRLGKNWYSWYGTNEPANVKLFLQLTVPQGTRGLEQIRFLTRGSEGGEKFRRALIRTVVMDTDGNEMDVSGAFAAPPTTPTEIVLKNNIPGYDSFDGVFEPGEEFNIMFHLRSMSGIGIHLGQISASFIT